MFEFRSGATVWPCESPSLSPRDAQVKEGTVLNLAVSEGIVVATPVEQRKWSHPDR